MNFSQAKLLISLVFAVQASFFSAAVLAQTDADRDEAQARGFDGFHEREKIAIAWRTTEADQVQVIDLAVFIEEIYGRISNLLGPDRTPTRRIIIVLAGPGISPDGRVRFPNVDAEGRVILVRYGNDIASYGNEVTHELVHAFRRLTDHPYSEFWEEGFAELVTMRVHPDEIGFPRYGYPLVVVSGHLLDQNEYIPLNEIRVRHSELGNACQLQSYLERASFFDFLANEHGMERLQDFIYANNNPGEAEFEQTFGVALERQITAWEAWLLNEYRSFPGAAEIAARFRAEPPIRARNICQPD